MSTSPQTMEQAFLDSIVAQPSILETGLILADWLEDQDDPRAELVRLTWQLQHERQHRDFEQRQSRVQRLLASGLLPVVPRLHLHGFDFVWIPPGRFFLGSPISEISRDDDEALHEVTIAAGFWMSTYPTTQSQWEAVMGDNPSAFSPDGDEASSVANLTAVQRARLPVDHVAWEQMPNFCSRLGQILSRTVCLPSEAQWEYACRAGTTSAFPFGDVLDGSQANCMGTTPYGTTQAGPSLNRPTCVGSYPPNAWGLYDTIGNVGEWTRDTFRRDYEALPTTDPVWEEAAPRRIVFRGGSWDRNPIYCRTAYRNHIGPQARTNNIGCRVVLA